MIAKNPKELNKILKRRINTNTEKNIRTYLNRSALLVEGTAKESIQRDPKTGVIYKKYNPNRTHQASKEGEAPASDTGYLVSNISHQTVRKEGSALVASVVSAAPYSDYLEFGTKNMGERPFLQPALEKNANKIEDIFKRGGLIK